MEWKYDKQRKALMIASVDVVDVLSLMLEESMGEFGPEHYRKFAPWGSLYEEIEIIEAPNVAVVPGMAFAWLPNLLAADLSSAVVVGNSAFYDCVSLKSVSFPKVQLIGNSAFCGCRSLRGVNGGSTLELRETRHVSAFAFHRCESLTSVTFKKKGNRVAEDGHVIAEAGSNLEFVGEGAFAGCVQLKKFSHGGKASKAIFGPNVFHRAGINPINEDLPSGE